MPVPFLRSEEMRHGIIVAPLEDAHDLIASLGYGLEIEFTDENESLLHRPYDKIIRRIIQIEEKINWLIQHIEELNFGKVIRGDPNHFLTRETSIFDFPLLEKQVEKYYDEVSRMFEIQKSMIEEKKQIWLELKVLEKAKEHFLSLMPKDTFASTYYEEDLEDYFDDEGGDIGIDALNNSTGDGSVSDAGRGVNEDGYDEGRLNDVRSYDPQERNVSLSPHDSNGVEDVNDGMRGTQRVSKGKNEPPSSPLHLRGENNALMTADLTNKSRNNVETSQFLSHGFRGIGTVARTSSSMINAVGFSVITGILNNSDLMQFSKLLALLTRGNAYVFFDSIDVRFPSSFYALASTYSRFDATSTGRVKEKEEEKHLGNANSAGDSCQQQVSGVTGELTWNSLKNQLSGRRSKPFPNKASMTPANSPSVAENETPVRSNNNYSDRDRMNEPLLYQLTEDCKKFAESKSIFIVFFQDGSSSFMGNQIRKLCENFEAMMIPWPASLRDAENSIRTLSIAILDKLRAIDGLKKFGAEEVDDLLRVGELTHTSRNSRRVSYFPSGKQSRNGLHADDCRFRGHDNGFNSEMIGQAVANRKAGISTGNSPFDAAARSHGDGANTGIQVLIQEEDAQAASDCEGDQMKSSSSDFAVGTQIVKGSATSCGNLRRNLHERGIKDSRHLDRNSLIEEWRLMCVCEKAIYDVLNKCHSIGSVIRASCWFPADKTEEIEAVIQGLDNREDSLFPALMNGSALGESAQLVQPRKAAGGIHDSTLPNNISHLNKRSSPSNHQEILPKKHLEKESDFMEENSRHLDGKNSLNNLSEPEKNTALLKTEAIPMLNERLAYKESFGSISFTSDARTPPASRSFLLVDDPLPAGTSLIITQDVESFRKCSTIGSSIDDVEIAHSSGQDQTLQKTSRNNQLSKEKHSVKLKAPTLIRMNDFTACFQMFVDIYGTASYREVNPGLFTIITMPFIFGVMFGDVGHGAILLMISLGIFISQQKSLGFLWMMRYGILMMGLFSIYCGFLYNDFFGLGMDLFGSRWVEYPSSFGALSVRSIHDDVGSIFPTNLQVAGEVGFDGGALSRQLHYVDMDDLRNPAESSSNSEKNPLGKPATDKSRMSSGMKKEPVPHDAAFLFGDSTDDGISKISRQEGTGLRKPIYCVTDNRLSLNFEAVCAESEVLLGPTTTRGFPYPFGIDIAWRKAQNELAYSNSVKMKFSIIFGLVHMVFGYFVQMMNQWHMKHRLDIVFIAIPRLLFMITLVGYLCFVIIVKWLSPVTTESMQRVGLIAMFVDMFMFGKVSGSDEWFSSQQTVQSALVSIAVITIPWMILSKPIYQFINKRAKKPHSAKGAIFKATQTGGNIAHTSEAGVLRRFAGESHQLVGHVSGESLASNCERHSEAAVGEVLKDVYPVTEGRYGPTETEKELSNPPSASGAPNVTGDAHFGAKDSSSALFLSSRYTSNQILSYQSCIADLLQSSHPNAHASGVAVEDGSLGATDVKFRREMSITNSSGIPLLSGNDRGNVELGPSSVAIAFDMMREGSENKLKHGGHDAETLILTPASPLETLKTAGDAEEEDDGFIGLAIESIEILLGTFSNTASYLRLWALSLAHAEMSNIIFFCISIPLQVSLSIAVKTVCLIIGGYVFVVITFVLIICLHSLESVLHCLRLHWIEFQSRFFQATGRAFDSFDLRQIAKNSR